MTRLYLATGDRFGRVDDAGGDEMAWALEGSGGLADPLDSMPYALSATSSKLFAGFGDGQMHRSGDGGETWERLPVRADAIVALAAVGGGG